MTRAKRRTNKRKIKLYFRIAFLLLLLGFVWYLRQIIPDMLPQVMTTGTKYQAAEKLRTDILSALYRFGLEPHWMVRKGRELQVHIPKNLHPLVIYQGLAQIIEKAGGTITQGREEAKNHGLTFSYALNRRAIDKIRLIPDANLPKTTGKIAIIIDDLGYNTNPTVQAFIDLPYPLTYSVIPGLPYSKKIAAWLHRKDKPIMIHMPMEPMRGKVEADGYTLLTALPQDQIRQRMRHAIKSLPYATGVNNHMGSKATTDSVLLEAAFEEIKKAGYFFVDSRTTQSSIAYSLALRAGLPALQNTLFLDAVDDSAHIAMKLHRLARVAGQEGYAVGIGHPKRNTLAMIKEVLPILEIQGYRLVKVEALLRSSFTYTQ